MTVASSIFFLVSNLESRRADGPLGQLQDAPPTPPLRLPLPPFLPRWQTHPDILVQVQPSLSSWHRSLHLFWACKGGQVRLQSAERDRPDCNRLLQTPANGEWILSGKSPRRDRNTCIYKYRYQSD